MRPSKWTYKRRTSVFVATRTSWETNKRNTATHCHTLLHTAMHCTALQHYATHCSTLQHTVTLCNKSLCNIGRMPVHTHIHINTHRSGAWQTTLCVRVWVCIYVCMCINVFRCKCWHTYTCGQRDKSEANQSFSVYVFIYFFEIYVSLCISVYTYICISIYTYICISMYIYICIWMSPLPDFECVCVHILVYVYLYMYLCVSLFIRIYVSLYIRMYVYD